MRPPAPPRAIKEVAFAIKEVFSVIMHSAVNAEPVRPMID